ncbi:ATP-binding cassette domain-containing protein [Bombilactobacillus folatiphilus]|uniref:UvrABC system protein A n=1 Tax=Bombilactobacillus folatiphilus TaxID=2923362 RepID=A0ABY4P9T7_9LACO|nr:ATP-binding cassette domain-containing protein [Bombilactobacillus folatiphilus]UQS82490.1 ATP-binding cassette domain-containing protein [Bombilactobacillus folatiphilus]
MQRQLNVNLGYIKLVQSLDTFSGGELQNVKLAKVLLQGHMNLLVLDEPTSGLHEANI